MNAIPKSKSCLCLSRQASPKGNIFQRLVIGFDAERRYRRGKTWKKNLKKCLRGAGGGVGWDFGVEREN